MGGGCWVGELRTAHAYDWNRWLMRVYDDHITYVRVLMVDDAREERQQQDQQDD